MSESKKQLVFLLFETLYAKKMRREGQESRFSFVVRNYIYWILKEGYNNVRYKKSIKGTEF